MDRYKGKVSFESIISRIWSDRDLPYAAQRLVSLTFDNTSKYLKYSLQGKEIYFATLNPNVELNPDI